jgi:hypothetical protein
MLDTTPAKKDGPEAVPVVRVPQAVRERLARVRDPRDKRAALGLARGQR